MDSSTLGKAHGKASYGKRWLTPRAADAAAPRANAGGISAKNHTPTKAVGRRRRAADAIVGQGV